MNLVLEAIRKRRSVRSYETKTIAQETIEAILEAGNSAASGLNRQPWRFVVVQSPAFRQRLVREASRRWKRTIERKTGTADAYARQYLVDMFTRTFRWPAESYEKMMGRYGDMEDGIYYSAPVIIFVIGTNEGTHNLDCPMVCQNLMLAAYSFGLGSCWVGSGANIAEDQEIAEAIELRGGEKIFGPIVVGYPKGGFPEPPRKQRPVVKWI